MSSHYPRSIPGILVSLSLCVFLLTTMTFAFSSVTFAASHTSQDSSFQEDLERASVSVVRLVITYVPSTGSTLPKPGNSKTSTNTPALFNMNASSGTSITCTGLGFIVASWANTASATPTTAAITPTPSASTTTTTATNTTWIMTDGSLVNKNGMPGASSCSIVPGKFTLSSIAVFFSSKYHSTLPPLAPVSISNPTVLCDTANEPNCNNGPVLFSMNTTGLYPYLEFPQTFATPTQPLASIALSNSSSSLNVPAPSDSQNANAFVTPIRIAIKNITSPQFGPVEHTQFGMPVVDARGFLEGIYASTQPGPAGSLAQPIVPASQLQSLLNSNKIDQTAHQNLVETNWNSGIDDFAKGQAFYAQAHNEFTNAFQLNNQFQGASQYAQRTVVSSGSGNTTSPGTQQGGIQLPLGVVIPFWLFILGITGIIVLIILLVLLNALFKRGRKHSHTMDSKQGPRPISEKESQQASPAPSVQQSVSPQVLQMPQLPQEMSPALHSMHNGTAGAAMPPPPPTYSSPPVPIAPAMPVPQMYGRGAIENQPTLVDFNQSTSTNEPADNDATVPKGQIPQRQLSPTQPARELGFEVITNTNAGLKRMHKPNEDSIFAVHGVRDVLGTLQQVGLFIVADGMGGHADGKVASTLAIQTIINHVLPKLMRHEEPLDNPAQLLAQGVQNANNAVHLHNMESHADMGTTVTSTMLIGTTAYVANVGDSRTYLYRYPNGLNKVTHDHSVVASLVDAGIIKEEDIYTHTKRNQIYRSLGEKPYVEVDTFIEPLQPNDKLLLCSDGMWEMVRDPNIRRILEEPVSNPQELGNRLIQAALDGGGEDNVSVIVVNVLESPNYAMNVGLQPIYQQEEVQLPAWA
jgi:serine/threonine protein phosphatase PrpC